MEFEANKHINLKAAIYARVSTEEQAEGYSIDAQIDTIRKFCVQRETEIVEEYIDRGISGKSIEGRYSLQKMLKDAEEGKFDVIYIWKISRLARKNVDLLTIVENLSKSNVKLYSISENFDTETTMGKFSLQMIGAVAEFERNSIVENVKLGMRQRARKGKWNGGIVLGYKSVKSSNPNKDDSRLEIVPEEAAIVRKIYNLYVSGKGLKAIANQINHEGYRTKRGNHFSTAAVKDIVTNPIYIGKVRFNRYENWSERRRRGKSEDIIIQDGNHDPIVDPELWSQVQLIQKKKASKPMKNYDGKYLLVGLMKCPMCGATMVSSRTTNKLKDGTKKVLRYYTCGAFKSKGSSVCSANSVRADYAEKYIMDRLQHVVQHKEVLSEIVSRVNQQKKGRIQPLQEELLSLESFIESVENRRDKYLRLYESNMVDQSMFVDRLNEIREERDQLLKKKHAIEEDLRVDKTQTLDIEYIRNTLKHFHDLIAQASFEQQKTLLHLIVKEIKVGLNKKIEAINLQLDNQKEITPKALSGEDLDRAFSICFPI
ncbi:recombinase family protein [Halobacillus trueperi]|uniref:recombinase family protein n=1 Tax=Halobacillus trueperi TaxID=156205 RepID=UPI003736663B